MSLPGDYRNTYRWRSTRRAVRLRAGGRCEVCGDLTPDGHAHHQHALADGGDPFDLGNLAWVCHRCHRLARNASATIAELRERLAEQQGQRTSPTTKAKIERLLAARTR